MLLVYIGSVGEGVRLLLYLGLLLDTRTFVKQSIYIRSSIQYSFSVVMTVSYLYRPF